MTFTNDQRQSAQRQRKIEKDAREAARVRLDEKTTICPDAPPGVGWRIETVGRPDRFYRTREQAIACWERTKHEKTWEPRAKP